MIITWPILFPIHATGGGLFSELELVSLSNVVNPKRLYAHAVVAWVFFGRFAKAPLPRLSFANICPGFVLLSIVRESIYFVNLRQAYLSSPFYADRLSSRTVLLTSVPTPYLDEARLRKLYGDSVRRVWIPKTSRELANAVKEREETAERLEKAEILLIKKANVARLKKIRQKEKEKAKSSRTSTEEIAGEKNNTTLDEADRDTEASGSVTSPSHEMQISTDPGTASPSISRAVSSTRSAVSIRSRRSDPLLDHGPQDLEEVEDPRYVHPYGYSSSLPDVRGSVAAQWIDAEQRPIHRPMGNFFRKRDTIMWCRKRLKELNSQIKKMRRAVNRDDEKKLSAAFIEFDSQESAQAAQQVLAHHRPLQMSPRHLGIRPDEVVWSTLSIPWWQRTVRRFSMLSLIAAAIIFWSIPSALVGLLASLEFLTGFVFLRWINDLPGPILGFIQGFVPALVLSLFMSLVPSMIRGKPSLFLGCARTGY